MTIVEDLSIKINLSKRLININKNNLNKPLIIILYKMKAFKMKF